MKNMKISGGMLVFLGALFWSLNAPLVKFINVDALLTAGCRATIAGVVLLPFLRPKKLNCRPGCCCICLLTADCLWASLWR